MQAEIMRKQMELAGADGDALQGINEQISSLRNAANQRQIEAIKATQDANASSGASYMESIQNIMTTAGKS